MSSSVTCKKCGLRVNSNGGPNNEPENHDCDPKLLREPPTIVDIIDVNFFDLIEKNNYHIYYKNNNV